MILRQGDEASAMDKQLAGLSFLLTLGWVAVVVLVMYWMS
jgi:hypothetical protein